MECDFRCINCRSRIAEQGNVHMFLDLSFCSEGCRLNWRQRGIRRQTVKLSEPSCLEYCTKLAQDCVSQCGAYLSAHRVREPTASPPPSPLMASRSKRSVRELGVAHFS
mmetsp:Transcript_35991/g.95537  ORF Transcript_35991/g.95537 Transcript_35991/m.95537 type:complete len:109 (-) Transcript_35991:198-524(-)